jgi:hypothetical protein
VQVRDVAKQSGVVMSRANQGLFNELQEFLGALKLIKIHGEATGDRRPATSGSSPRPPRTCVNSNWISTWCARARRWRFASAGRSL